MRFYIILLLFSSLILGSCSKTHGYKEGVYIGEANYRTYDLFSNDLISDTTYQETISIEYQGSSSYVLQFNSGGTRYIDKKDWKNKDGNSSYQHGSTTVNIDKNKLTYSSYFSWTGSSYSTTNFVGYK
jgi:hypothetical protein